MSRAGAGVTLSGSGPTAVASTKQPSARGPWHACGAGASPMRSDLTFILGIIAAAGPPCVTSDDLQGEHRAALVLWQHLGFLSHEPSWNPRPSCPYCREGVPFPLGGTWICDACLSSVE